MDCSQMVSGLEKSVGTYRPLIQKSAIYGAVSLLS